MLKNTKNSREQGAIGVAQAIAWFTKEGYTVSVPIAECQRYDLVVEKNGVLYKVEVKTSTFKAPSGNYEVMLATRGGNRSWNGTVAPFDIKDEQLLLFILLASGQKYLMPATDANRGTITLGKSHEKYKIE